MEDIEFDYKKLKGRIVERFETAQDFAKEVGVSPGCLSRKLNNKRDIKRSEIIQYAKILEIPESEIGEYFFQEKVAK